MTRNPLPLPQRGILPATGSGFTFAAMVVAVALVALTAAGVLLTGCSAEDSAKKKDSPSSSTPAAAQARLERMSGRAHGVDGGT